MSQQSSRVVEEYRNRVERIRERMRRTGLDGLLVMQPLNVWYVSGFWEYVPIRVEAVLIPVDGECTFMVSKNEYEYAVKTSWIDDVRYYTEFPEDSRHQNPYDLVHEVACDQGLDRAVIGIEEDFVPVAEYTRIADKLPNVKLQNAGAIFKQCRMVKSGFEVDLLKKAGQVACSGWHASMEAAQAGVSEYEIGQAARQAATRTAAAFMSPEEDKHHSPIVDGVQLIQAGERSSISHGRGSTNELHHGDMVAMCFCLTNQFKGYKVGFARNMAIGEATQEMRDVYKMLWDAQQLAFSELKPGVTGSHLDRIVREFIHAAGYGRYIEHRLGRGVGLLYAEAPDLKEGDDTVIEAGFCLSIEPAVYITGKWGIEIEDSVHVTPTGWEYLTEPAPPELPVV